MAFTDDFKHTMDDIDEKIKEYVQLKPKKPFDFNTLRIMICDAIRLQSNMKQLCEMEKN